MNLLVDWSRRLIIMVSLVFIDSACIVLSCSVPMSCHYCLYFLLTQSFLYTFVVVLHTDKWQQAYRYLGGYIDCSASWGDGSHDSGDNGGGEGGGGACSRWMMWAAVSWKFCYVHEMVHLSLHIS